VEGYQVAASDAKTLREQERELINRARAGEHAALREVVNLHKDRLYAFIWRMIRDHHDAEDICQDAFLKAFASLDTFSSEYRFSTWLFTIGYRVCLNHLRRRRSVGSEFDLSLLQVESGDNGTPAQSEEAAKVSGMVWSAVDQLSPPQRATVLLFYRHEFGCQEIAQVLQLPPATVKSHLHRARAKLRELLEPATQTDWTQFRNLSERVG
jgi:RNA polymerase sigma-70 factor (ECF subfamily)